MFQILIYFLRENWNPPPPEKSPPLLSQQPLSKSWDPIKHPLFKKFGWRLTPPPPAERGGRCTLCNTIEFSGSLAKVTAIACKRYFFQIFDWLMEFAIPHKSWTQHHRSKSEYLKKNNLLQHWWKNRAST